MMQLIRSTSGKILVPIIILAFVGWMVLEIGLEVTGGGGRRPGELGSVNGTVITAEAYNQAYQGLMAQARASGQDVTPEMEARIADQAWQQLVDDALIRQELKRRGIRATSEEVVWAARNQPHPSLAQQEIFQTDGRFDLAKYRQFLAGPQLTADMARELEAYYRDAIPREKLYRQVAAGRYLSDAELWRAFRDQNEAATVDYVQLDVNRLVPQAPAVSDADVERYYRENRERFRRQEGARVKVAFIPKTITEADRQATIRRAAELRAEIAGGADFAQVAQRESDDPGSAAAGGDLGTFTRGQMVAAFDSAVFSLPLNEVSQPVVTEYGAHLVQVQSRSGDTATARHILLEFQKDPAALDSLEDRMASVADAAGEQGLVKAAQAAGITVREGVPVTRQSPYIPGVGGAVEALSFARDADADPELGRVSEVLESDQALYLVEVEDYYGAGIAPLAVVAPQIHAQLEQERRRAAATREAEKLVAQVRGGSTLEQVAQANGLTVQRAGPFTRVEANPALGQTNAAIGAAFATPIGQVSPVVETPAGLYIIRPVERTEASREVFEQQKQALRAQAIATVQQDLFGQWLTGAREAADIEDNRARMMQQS